MNFQINTASGRPIYEQIVEQAREAIARGELEAETQLPSVRQLSRDLVVNPNTIARAYSELEREGLVVTKPGRGVFVTQAEGDISESARTRRLLESLDRWLTEAVHLRFSSQEVVRHVQERIKQFQWNPAVKKKGKGNE